MILSTSFVDITSLRVSFSGIDTHQIDQMYSVIQKAKVPLSLTRVSGKNLAFTRTDILLEGRFNFEFLQNISTIFPAPLGVSIDVTDYPQIIDMMRQYSSLQWELDKMLLLGTTIFPIETMKKIIPVADNNEFLKLLLLTPAAMYLKNLLITKPKGAVVYSHNRLHFLLTHQKADFIFIWLEKILRGEVIDFDWLSGLTGELPENYIVNARVPPDVESNIDRWLETVRSHEVDDYYLVYRKVLEVSERMSS